VTIDFVSVSLVAVFSAMAVYTLAFIAYTLDLAKRSAPAPAAVAPAAVLNSSSVATTTVGTVGGKATALLERITTDAPVSGRTREMKIAFALTIIGWALHVVAALSRGIAAGRVPWANMFEFSLTATAIIIGVFIFVQVWQDLRFLGAYVIGFSLILLGVATTNFYVDVIPLPASLQSGWLVIHVFVATLGTAFFSLGAGLSLVQLLQARREAGRSAPRFMATLPSAEKLENLAYRLILIGFVFWTFTLIAGAIWAQRAWGRYWGWDTKEVWTFIIWTIFAGYIHARATRGWRGSRSAWLVIIGFSAVMFNFTVVNLFFKGLHAYSGL